MLLPLSAGILVADRLQAKPWVFVLVTLSGLALWRLRRDTWLAPLGELLLGMGLGALALAVRLHAPVPEASAGPVPLTLLTPPLRRGPACRVEVYVHGADGGRALVRTPEEACSWLPGQRALGRIRLDPLRPSTNPGQSSPARRWARRGIQRAGSVRQALLFPVGPPVLGLAARLERARRALGDGVDPPALERRSGALLRALVSGDRGRLSDATRRAFVRSGTAHLLAVSGLHVAWVFVLTHLGVGWILRRAPSVAVLRRAKTLSLAAGVITAGGYAVLSGLAVPALRAAVMAFAGTLALLGGRPGTAWNALALAALVVLAWDPGSLFEPGFALSFVAVAGILVWGAGGGRLASLVHGTLGAGLATAPFLAAIDAPLPRLFLLANLLAIPLFGAVVLPLGLVTGAASALFPAAAGVLGPLARAAGELGIRLVEALESPNLLEGSAHPIRSAIGLAAAGFAARLASRRSFRAALGAGGIAACTLLLALPCGSRTRAEADTSLLFLDVGHGDASVLRSAARAWLVDAGPRIGSFDAGRHVVRPALRAEGLGELEVMLLSHADRDHVGGAREILEAVPVGELWVTAAAWQADVLEPVRRIAARRGIPIRFVSAGDRAWLPPLEVSVLWPPQGFVGSDTNQSSLVLRVEGPHGCALLPGDVPRTVERGLAHELRSCEVLKLAHHGSRSSTDSAWLRRLRPWVAIASAGRRSRLPLPHAEVRERLRAESVTLYETRRFGALRVRFTEAGLVVEPHLSEPWREGSP